MPGPLGQVRGQGFSPVSLGNWIASQRCLAVWVEEAMASRKAARLTEKLISIPISIPIPISMKDLKDGLCCNKSILEPDDT